MASLFLLVESDLCDAWTPKFVQSQLHWWLPQVTSQLFLLQYGIISLDRVKSPCFCSSNHPFWMVEIPGNPSMKHSVPQRSQPFRRRWSQHWGRSHRTAGTPQAAKCCWIGRFWWNFDGFHWISILTPKNGSNMVHLNLNIKHGITWRCY